MSHRAASCLIAALISLFTTLVSVEAFRLVQEEDLAGVTELAELSLGENRYPIVSASDESHCVGEIVATLSDSDDQFTVTTTGWIRIALGGATWSQELFSTAAFNPLGQLSAGIFQTTVEGREFRLGFLNINPITVQLVTSPPLKTIFQQSIPGPVEIKKRGETMVITTRTLSDVIPVAAHDQLSELPLPIRVRRADESTPACHRKGAAALDLTPVLKSIETLNSQLGSMLSPGRP